MPALDDPLDVVGRERQLEVVGVALDHPVDEVDLLGDGPRGVRVLARDVDRPELGLDAPLAQPRDVGLARVEPLADVEPLERDVALVAEPPGEVVVAVEEQAGGVDLPGPLRDRGGPSATDDDANPTSARTTGQQRVCMIVASK